MRIIDFVVSLGSLILLGPLMIVVAILVKLTSPGPVLYRAPRVGRGGQLFTMYKFRTMRLAGDDGPRITAGDHDPRVTAIGGWLRRFKLDELPQLFNILRGQMGLVGPRPEDPSFLRFYTAEEREVLSTRPGLTAPVQLIYHELAERHLRPDEDPTQYYIDHVLHQHLAMDLDYVRTRTFGGDLLLIWQTLLHIAGVRKSYTPAERAAPLDGAIKTTSRS